MRLPPKVETVIFLTASFCLMYVTPLRGDNITGGAVTGGSALSAGATFVDLTVPWGNATTAANTVGNDDFNNSPNLFAFGEVQQYTLAANLPAQVGQTTVSAGTTVNSDFVTFEPGNAYELIGHVDFSTPVLAIITSDAGLIASNFLGDAGVTYSDPASVGLEAGDTVIIDPSNPNQIDWDTSASIPGDSVRVITAATSVPEPSNLFAFGLGALAVLLPLRRAVRRSQNRGR